MKLSELDAQQERGDLLNSDRPTSMKLSQLESMDTIDVTEDSQGGITEVDDAQKSEWEKKGNIGFMEQWSREDGTEKIPFWGGVEGAYKGFVVLNAVNRIKRNEYKEPTVQSEDYRKVNEFILRAEEERIRGFSIGGNVTRGISNLPAFMLEFMATGGLAAIGKKAVKTVIGKGITTVAKSKTLSFAAGVAGVATGAALRTTVGMPQNVLDRYTDRQVASNIELTPKGLQIAKETKEAPVTSFFKAWGDVAIENFSEASGMYFGRYIAKPIKDILPVALIKSMEKVFLKIPKNKAVQSLWTKAGYNGFIGEMGEERLGDIMRAVTGVEDFGADNPHSVFDRLVASIPNGSELLTEALVISVPMAAQMSHQALADRYSKKKINGVEVGKAPESELREITDAEAEKIVLAISDPAALQKQIEEEDVELARINEQLFREEIPQSPASQKEVASPDAGLPADSQEPGVQIATEADFAPEQSPVKEVEIIKPKSTLLQNILVKIDALTDRDSKRQVLKDSLENVKEIKRSLFRRIKNFEPGTIFRKKLRLEEFIDIPKEFMSKDGIAIDEVMDEFNNSNSGYFFESTSDFINFLKETKKFESRLKDQISELGQPITTQKEITFLRQRIADITSGIRQGGIDTRKLIKDFQTVITEMIKGSDLKDNDKVKFISTIKNINNEKQFEKAIPEIGRQIEELERKDAKRTAKQAILDELYSTKVSKQSGKPVGKFTADIQVVLDALRAASKMDVEAALDRMNNLMSDPASMTAENEFEARILDMRINFEEESPETLQELLVTIQDIKAGGEALNEILRNDRKEAKEANVEAAVADLSGQKGIQKGAATFGIKDKDSTRNPFKGLVVNGIIGWNNILDWVSYKSGTRPGQSFISKFFDVFSQTRLSQAMKSEMMRNISDIYAESYGLKKDGDVIKHLREDTRPVNLGKFKNANEVDDYVVLTKAQARKKIMEMLDPSLSETFSSKDGMAYTEEIVSAIHKFMTVQDRVFIKKQLDFYQDFYKKINDVYKRMYGVNLPTNEFYSPIKRRGYVIKNNQLGEFMQEIDFRRRSVTSGALKSRVKSILPLEYVSDTMELEKHVAEMGHFIAWAEKVRDMNDVFTDPRFVQAMKENFGSSEYGVMNNFMQDFSRYGIDQAKRMEFFDWWRARTTQVALALRPVILIKQLTSTPAYLSSMSVGEFTSGIYDFWKHPKKNWEILREHPFFKYRADNIDRDLKTAMMTDAYKSWRKTPSFVNRLMFNVQLGDQLSIAMGGWAVYKKSIKAGMSHEQALEEFARVSNETQQSGDLSEQSVFQRAGSFAKLFTMFKTSPNQYLRKEIMAIRNLLGKRITPKEAAKTIFIYHFLLPMIFQWVSDFGRFNGKNQLRAALMGSANGLFIVGDFLEAILSNALGIKSFRRSAIELPVSKILMDITKSLTSIDWNDIQEEDFWQAVDGLSGVAGFATKIPIKQMKDMVSDTVENLEDGEYWNALGSALGWSKYSLTDDD